MKYLFLCVLSVVLLLGCNSPVQPLQVTSVPKVYDCSLWFAFSLAQYELPSSDSGYSMIVVYAIDKVILRDGSTDLVEKLVPLPYRSKIAGHEVTFDFYVRDKCWITIECESDTLMNIGSPESPLNFRIVTY